MSLDLDQLSALFDLLAEKDIAEFEHEDEAARLRIVRGKIAVAPASVAATPVGVAHAHAAPAGVTQAESDVAEVTSPFVGTFYRSPSPDAPSFVDVGSMVRPGQALCIIEAMKLMNEIESDVAGEVLERIAISAQPVEYGQPLFAIKPR